MGRPQKPGLTYFPLDVHIADDIELLEVDCGLEGFAILVKLWQKIYSECYYIEWGEDHEKLFSRKIAVDHEAVKNVIENCFKRGLLSKEMFDRYSILTSHGVQKRYLKACTDCKRTNITMIKEYLLIKDEELLSSIKTLKSINSDKTEVITEETKVFPEETNITSEISTQSKVKESKEEKSKELKEFLNSICDIYPNNNGKNRMSEKKIKELMKVGYDSLKIAVERYLQYVKTERDNNFNLRYKDCSTFFNTGYKDYLDGEHKPVDVVQVKQETKSTGFINGIGNVLTKNGGLDDDKERNSVNVNENQRLLSEFPEWNERK